jgi:hypothetical protein
MLLSWSNCRECEVDKMAVLLSTGQCVCMCAWCVCVCARARVCVCMRSETKDRSFQCIIGDNRFRKMYHKDKAVTYDDRRYVVCMS